MEATGTAWRVKCAVAVLVGVVGCGGAREPASEATRPRSTPEALSSAPPDFVITQVSGPNGPNGPQGVTGGSSFRVNVTVCNRGGETRGVELGLYLSQDANIVPGQDSSVGTLSSSAPLVPGECAVREVMGSANVPTGAWYVGAVADPTNQEPELNESNNALAGGLLGVGSRPDFVVTQVTGPSSVRIGQTFTANFTVCNAGTVSDNTTVNLLLSSDAVITETDRVIVGGYSVGTVPAGQCVSRAVQTAVPSSVAQGAWYLGAFADQSKVRVELIESNNTLAGTLMGVGSRPDFVITSVTGAPRMAQRSEQFPVTVQVCNQGYAPGSTVVELYLSPDALITREQDYVMGGTPVGSLNPGACATVVVSAKGTPPADGEFFLGAIVDVPNAVVELIESNNTFTAGRIGIGSRPDLTVTKVTAPAYVALGSLFDASVTVCNQGNAPGGAPLELVFSKDAVIVPSASVLGEGDLSALQTSVASLMPGLCTTLAVKLQASFPFSQPDGEYRLGAIVDPGNILVEFFESNNAYAGNVMGIGNGPDLVVQSLSAPTSVVAGASFEFSATVCNRGTVMSGGTDLVVALSSDTELLPPVPPSPSGDVFIYGTYVNPLLPGQCSQVMRSAGASVPEGAWYVGALIDPPNNQWELIESNNMAVSALMGVGSKPDFVVTKVQGPASVHAGEPIVASVTVCNQGTVSGSSDVALLVSPDETFTAPGPTGDLLVDELPTAMLAAGACQTMQLGGSVFVPEGQYFLGAVADVKNLRPELIESNNARSAGLLGIGSKPDFIITALTGPATARPGDWFPATVEVCNQGTEPAATNVELLLSQDEFPTVPGSPGWDGDSSIGRFATPYLARGQCTKVPVETSLPWSGGPGRELRLGAIVDSRQERPELNENNNAYIGGAVGVGLEPDFVIKEVKSVPIVPRGSSFEVSLTVCNQGFSPGGTEVLVMLSSDAIITAPQPGGTIPDELLGSLYTGSLQPGQCSTQNVQAYASSGVADGAYYLGAVADPGGSMVELLESNNTRVGGLIGLGDAPDFIVTKVQGPPSARPGSPFDVSATVCNQGTISGAPVVSFFLSRDTVFDGPGVPPFGDRIVHSVPVGNLMPRQCLTVPARPQAPEVGAWYVGASAASGSSPPEHIENNNVYVGGVMGVGDGPDFIVTKVEGPVVSRQGEPLRVSATVCNQGTAFGGASLELLLSREPLSYLPYPPSAEPYPLGLANLSNLAPGRCISVSMDGSAFVPQGPWYLVGSIHDHAGSELLQSNNVLTGGVVGLGSGPELVVTKVTGLKNVLPGESLALSATVCNQGTTGSSSTDIVLVLSSDTTISAPPQPDPGDVLLGGASIGPLEPEQCSTVPVPGSVPYLQGVVLWNLGAVVDPNNFVQELIESNNVRVEGQLGVGHGPDFVITEVTGPVRAYPGEQSSLSATVCNQGTTEGYTGLAIGLSSDAEHLSQPPDVSWLVDTFVGFLLPGQCSTQQLSVPIYTPGEGEYLLVAMADSGNFSWELLESNNLRVGEVVGVGHGPDFVVTEVTGPTSVRPEEPFEVSATVCNQGLAVSSPEVSFYLSQDALIVPPGVPFEDWDNEFIRTFVGTLVPGQCTTVQVLFPGLSAQMGSHYLGAAADPGRYVVEPLESNNTRVGPRLGVGNGPDSVVVQP
ncbi:CARDB domain-containing protein [Archangium lansingense]|uniref:CARDB domain-containing protein n=1 Tax=Archangium lansingense TaxID=2995310 RepID=A0ABT4AJ11_9BACT|nr:CARDB domain-containing protein [Archangium lansinium]MCY1080874.1 hypothetical protein [Archangium lansinium]